MVCQYKSWRCPQCGARVDSLAAREELRPEHQVCERCWRATVANERFAARKAALAAAKEAVAAAYALLRDAPLGELARRNDELIAADEAYRRLRREGQ